MENLRSECLLDTTSGLEQLLLSTSNGVNEENAQRKEDNVNSLVEGFRSLAVEEKILFLIRIREHCNSVPSSGSNNPGGSQNNGVNHNSKGKVTSGASTLSMNSNIDAAKRWLQQNFTYDPEVAIPKEEIYSLYSNSVKKDKKPISTADFGKLMRQVFPQVKARRLGQRGHSKYCYANIKKVNETELPSLSLNQPLNFENGGVTHMDWARRHFGVNFHGLGEFFEFLKGNFKEGLISVASANKRRASGNNGRSNSSGSSTTATSKPSISTPGVSMIRMAGELSPSSQEDRELRSLFSKRRHYSSGGFATIHGYEGPRITDNSQRSQSVPIVEQWTSVFDDVLFEDLLGSEDGVLDGSESSLGVTEDRPVV